MAITFAQFQSDMQFRFSQKPHEFYAKKFDLNPHILDQHQGHHPSMCGKLGAALGNNYAPLLNGKTPICTECLKIAYEVFVREFEDNRDELQD